MPSPLLPPPPVPHMLKFSFLWSIRMRRVALPSSTSPRRMLSKRARDSAMGRSRQGLGARCSRDASISSLVCGAGTGFRGNGGAGRTR